MVAARGALAGRPMLAPASAVSFAAIATAPVPAFHSVLSPIDSRVCASPYRSGPAWHSCAQLLTRQRQQQRQQRCTRLRSKSGNNQGPSVENAELLIGDCIVLVNFCLFKQISAIVLSPSFPGWLAPLNFNPDRFLEFLSFTGTVCGVWVAAALLTGGYAYATTAGRLPRALKTAALIWAVSMPVAAAQLVLVAATESRSLVGTEEFGSILPLAARGTGEPFVTAVGILAAMSLWRCIYTVYLDVWNNWQLDEPRSKLASDAASLREAMQLFTLLALLAGVTLQVVETATKLVPDTLPLLDSL